MFRIHPVTSLTLNIVRNQDEVSFYQSVSNNSQPPAPPSTYATGKSSANDSDGNPSAGARKASTGHCFMSGMVAARTNDIFYREDCQIILGCHALCHGPTALLVDLRNRFLPARLSEMPMSCQYLWVSFILPRAPTHGCSIATLYQTNNLDSSVRITRRPYPSLGIPGNALLVLSVPWLSVAPWPHKNRGILTSASVLLTAKLLYSCLTRARDIFCYLLLRQAPVLSHA